MTKVIFLNGPPGCGKDFAGRLFATKYVGRVHVDKFARVLKEATHALYGIFIQGKPAPHDWMENRKDEPASELFGLTPRQAYIAVSETYMKEQHGKRIFGQLLERQLGIEAAGADLIVITDSGFREEAEVLVERYGADNCLMIHLQRSECSFDGDSRSRVDLSDLGVKAQEVVNPGTPDGLLEALSVAYPPLRCNSPSTPASTPLNPRP